MPPTIRASDAKWTHPSLDVSHTQQQKYSPPSVCVWEALPSRLWLGLSHGTCVSLITAVDLLKHFIYQRKPSTDDSHLFREHCWCLICSSVNFSLEHRYSHRNISSKLAFKFEGMYDYMNAGRFSSVCVCFLVILQYIALLIHTVVYTQYIYYIVSLVDDRWRNKVVGKVLNSGKSLECSSGLHSFDNNWEHCLGRFLLSPPKVTHERH